MKVRKVIWWLAVILLVFSVTASIIMVQYFGSKQYEFIDQFMESVNQNPTVWEKIEIGGTDPLSFNKGMWIANSAMLSSTTWSVIFFGTLTLLLFITLQCEKRKNRKHIADGKT